MESKPSVRNQGMMKKPDIRPSRIKKYATEEFTKTGIPRCTVCRKAVYKTQDQDTCNGKLRHFKCWPDVMDLWQKVEEQKDTNLCEALAEFRRAKHELECK